MRQYTNKYEVRTRAYKKAKRETNTRDDKKNPRHETNTRPRPKQYICTDWRQNTRSEIRKKKRDVSQTRESQKKPIRSRSGESDTQRE